MKEFLGLRLCLIVSSLYYAQAQEKIEEPKIMLNIMKSFPDNEKPLVRCKRPMCDDLECPKGYQLDSRGCETCNCLTSQCEVTDCKPNYICKDIPCSSFPCTVLQSECVSVENPVEPSTSLPPLPCPLPLCANPCPYGRKVNSEGCETCECSMEEPEPKTQCPMKKCSMCQFGYARDDNGCHSCSCLPNPCEGKICPDHQQCSARWADCLHVPCPKVGECTWRGLCLYRQDNQQLLSELKVQTDGTIVDCNEDGTFNPLQCSADRKQCWCVDDTGHEIELTRKTVYSDEDVPFCLYNRTISIVMTFSLEGEEDVDVNLPTLKGTVHEHISRWLMVEKHYIDEVEIWEEPNEVIMVSYVVTHDGKTDLPSAAHQLSRQMHQGHCSIDFKGNTLKPQPNSLQMEHRFMPVDPPRVSDPGLMQDRRMEKCFLRRWYRNHHTAFVVGAIGGCIILSFVTAVIISVLMKRRRNQIQFRHRRLSNYQKNLSLIAESSYLPVVEDKKEPLTDDGINLSDSTEKLVRSDSQTVA